MGFFVRPCPQRKRHLDRFSRFLGDRPTDHSTRSITVSGIYVRDLVIIVAYVDSYTGFHAFIIKRRWCGIAR